MDDKTYKALKKIAKGNLHQPQLSVEMFYEISRQGYILPTSNRNDLLVLTDKGKRAFTEESTRRREARKNVIVTIACTLATIAVAIIIALNG